MRPDDVEALARALVAALLPALADAMLAGIMPRAAFEAAGRQALPHWHRAYGVDVADAAFMMLQRLSPAVVLCEDLQDEWLAAGPIADLAARPPPEAIPDPPPLRGIARLRQALARPWRWR